MGTRNCRRSRREILLRNTHNVVRAFCSVRLTLIMSQLRYINFNYGQGNVYIYGIRVTARRSRAVIRYSLELFAPTLTLIRIFFSPLDPTRQIARIDLSVTGITTCLSIPLN